MKRILGFVLALGISFGLFAQAMSSTQSQVIADQMGLEDNSVGTTVEKFPDPQLAMSVPNYPVTCGDVYTLAFAAGNSPVTYSIPVDTTYKIRVANLGVINAAGLTYQQLKQQVEALVQRNYPMGGVQFVLTSPATFLVTIKGEVKATTEKNAWALTRLSTFVRGSFTSYSSNRKVQVISTNGTKKTYDLFKASRDGDLSQDPYLRPGDVIVVSRRDRKVTISGAVERPGTYELLAGENLKNLVEYYGNGLTEAASTERIELLRFKDAENKAGTKSYLGKDAITSNYELKNGDEIVIQTNSSFTPRILVEGIIRNPNAGQDSADTAKSNDSPSNTSYRQFFSFYNGENYSTFIRRINNIFNSYSDLKNAYFERSGERFYIDIEKILYDAEFVSDYYLQADDKLTIPFQQHFQTILVNGEVNTVREESAWPLRRLSSVISDNLTAYSSTRNIIVTSLEGQQNVYDLFKANRFGDMSQNPYIRAGETITIQRRDRKVTIYGAVERPGTYELLEGENLKDLVEYYGNGLSESASTDRIELLRFNETENKAGSKSYLDKSSIVSNFELKNGDQITIQTNEAFTPKILVEGIIRNPNANQDSADTAKTNDSPSNTSYRQYFSFHAGENYSSFIRRISNVFNSYSDLKNAYFERLGRKYYLDIEKILYDSEFISEYNLQADDKLVIPFQQHFQTILVNGEVNSVREESAWPLRRLSSVISDNLTAYSSTRNIIVTSLEGQQTVYDLFKASRFGDMTQDPYIRAGETITIQRRNRKVTIVGAVERPGTYELLEGENLKNLVELYGNGLVALADTSRIELTRIIDTEDPAGDRFYLNNEHLEQNEQLHDGDVVSIGSFSDLRPVVFIEGAVYDAASAASAASAPSVANKLTQNFVAGENYAYFIRRNSKMFGLESDIDNVKLIRGEETIALDVTKMLYDKTYYSDLIVENEDHILVPFKQYFVTVAGAVKNPGRFPYIPGRDPEYYIALAGGFDMDRNVGDSYSIVDMNGKRIKHGQPVTPEASITANTNSFLYYFGKYAPVVTTVLSAVSTGISVYMLSKSASSK